MTEETKKESIRIEYSDAEGIMVHLTNEGMKNLAEGASDFVAQAMKDSPLMKTIQERLGEARGMIPEMPPVRKAKSAGTPAESTLGIAEVPPGGPEVMGAMEPQTDGPWQDANHAGPTLSPFGMCRHESPFIAKDIESLLRMVVRLGYKKTHLGEFNGAGIYCADCLHRLD